MMNKPAPKLKVALQLLGCSFSNLVLSSLGAMCLEKLDSVVGDLQNGHLDDELEFTNRFSNQIPML
jgi:hypothetical protein